jgi:hypothetical protein
MYGKGGFGKCTIADLAVLIEVLVEVSGLTLEEISNGRKKREVVRAKEALIIVGKKEASATRSWGDCWGWTVQ